MVDARNAYQLARDYLTEYDRKLGVCDRARWSPAWCSRSPPAPRPPEDHRRAEHRRIGTNNTVVYTVGQEVQLILDAFEGKAAAINHGRQVVRTYETNMGGRFVSHLREVEAEKIFVACAAKAGEQKAGELLDALAESLKVPPEKIPAGRCLAEKAARSPASRTSRR